MNQPVPPDRFPYHLHCGAMETMQKIATRGKFALNPRTMRWKLVSKTAQYKVVEDNRPFDEQGRERIPTADLFCNEDLKRICKEKSLIF